MEPASNSVSQSVLVPTSSKRSHHKKGQKPQKSCEPLHPCAQLIKIENGIPIQLCPEYPRHITNSERQRCSAEFLKDLKNIEIHTLRTVIHDKGTFLQNIPAFRSQCQLIFSGQILSLPDLISFLTKFLDTDPAYLEILIANIQNQASSAKQTTLQRLVPRYNVPDEVFKVFPADGRLPRLDGGLYQIGDQPPSQDLACLIQNAFNQLHHPMSTVDSHSISIGTKTKPWKFQCPLCQGNMERVPTFQITFDNQGNGYFQWIFWQHCHPIRSAYVLGRKACFTQEEKLSLQTDFTHGVNTGKMRENINRPAKSSQIYEVNRALHKIASAPVNIEDVMLLAQKFPDWQMYYLPDSSESSLITLCVNRQAIEWKCYLERIYIDDTEKTNYNDLPVIGIVGVDENDRSQYIGCAFIGNKEAATFYYFGLILKQAFGDIDPYVIIMDRNPAQIQGISQAFPTSFIFFCWIHIQRNLLSCSEELKQAYDNMIKVRNCNSLPIMLEAEKVFLNELSKLGTQQSKQLLAQAEHYLPSEAFKRKISETHSNRIERSFGEEKYAYQDQAKPEQVTVVLNHFIQIGNNEALNTETISAEMKKKIAMLPVHFCSFLCLLGSRAQCFLVLQFEELVAWFEVLVQQDEPKVELKSTCKWCDPAYVRYDPKEIKKLPCIHKICQKIKSIVESFQFCVDGFQEQPFDQLFLHFLQYYLDKKVFNTEIDQFISKNAPNLFELEDFSEIYHNKWNNSAVHDRVKASEPIKISLDEPILPSKPQMIHDFSKIYAKAEKGDKQCIDAIQKISEMGNSLIKRPGDLPQRQKLKRTIRCSVNVPFPDAATILGKK